jgi:hypothetical protein
MRSPHALTHIQLAAIVADVQAILWQESRLLPDFPREYGEYWNPAKEHDSRGRLDAARFHARRPGPS